jgi:hypothetical protein
VKIEFARVGGFAGMRTQLRLDVDQLAPDERAEIVGLVRDADFFALAPEYRAPRPDAFQYRITVEEQGHSHRVAVDERAAPDPLRPLLSKLVEYARHSA